MHRIWQNKSAKLIFGSIESSHHHAYRKSLQIGAHFDGFRFWSAGDELAGFAQMRCWREGGSERRREREGERKRERERESE